MKKGLNKIKAAAENLSRSSKIDKNSDELNEVEKQVDRYNDVLRSLHKKISPNTGSSDDAAREKRSKKIHEHMLGQIMEDSTRDLHNGLLRTVLEKCASLEKSLASEIVNYEVNVENNVKEKLSGIIEQHISTIQKQRQNVKKCYQDHEAAKQKHLAASRVSDNQKDHAKINQLKDNEEELAVILEKERDMYAAQMFELLAEEESIVNYVISYVKFQQLYYQSALKEIDPILDNMSGLLRKTNKKVFNTSLNDHLVATGRQISFVIELCVCCLVERGLYEEGLLRVGCATSKLKRMIAAIDANYVGPPLPDEYKDVHVIAGVLKKYLRSLPEPLLTSTLYQDFVMAAQKHNEEQRKHAILDIVNRLPQANYDNLRYLMKFLSYLSEKNAHNKMSPQNLAIVMSPNLLSLPQNDDQNYLEQVSSTATVNTIVEALIADWHFFFKGDVDFYVSMTRDELFPDNGGFPYDKEQHMMRTVPMMDMMSRSMIVTNSNPLGSGTDEKSQGKGSLTHSRSSSHDTSLILINEHMKRSQSNSSLSDHSSPPQETSPKLPGRRKNKKPVAPTPPDVVKLATSNIGQRDANSKLQMATSAQYLKQFSNNVTGDEDCKSLPHMSQNVADKVTKFGSHDNLLKMKEAKIPPPRPQPVNAECQTLTRMKNHQKPNCDSQSNSTSGNSSIKETNSNSNAMMPPLPAKPIAAPRPSLRPTNSGGNENDENAVIVREKPAIPERPTTILRPPSFKGTLNDVTSRSSDSSSPTAAPTLKKTQSFRGESTTTGGGHGHTMLERTQFYNIDKQQVAIIDVVDPAATSNNHHHHHHHKDKEKEKDKDKERDKDQRDEQPNNFRASQTSLNDFTQVPPSPRGFDAKVKRPQVPAPPPPTSRPKSTDSSDL